MELSGFVNVSETLKAGCYALAFKGEVVYVGKAKRMLTRVYAHLHIWHAKRRGKKPPWETIDGIYFDEVFVRYCHPDRVDLLEREMIELYKPRLNIQLKKKGPTRAPFSIQIRGLTIPFNMERAKPTLLLIERRL